MIIRIAVFCLLAIPAAQAATPARLLDGKAVYAYSKVGNHVCWTQAEHDESVASALVFVATSPVTSSLYMQSLDEQGAKSMKFENYTALEEHLKGK